MKRTAIFFSAFFLPALFCSLTGCSKKENPSPATVTPGGGPPPDSTVVLLPTDVAFWLTKGDQSALLKKQNVSLFFNAAGNGYPTIAVDTTQTFQSIDGFGFCLTDGSAYLINRLPATDRAAILKELFSTDSNAIGISYLRVSVGAS